MTSRLTSNAEAVRAAAGGTYYGKMYLAFATLAYTDESANNIVNVTIDLPTAVSQLLSPPVPSGETQWGTWSVDWGPVLSGTDTNLMYIASFRESPGAVPVITVLAIRGTDISAGPLSVMAEFFEDVSDWTQVQWSRASSGQPLPCMPGGDPSQPKIATGTCQGLQRLLGMSQSPAGGGSAVTAAEYLQSLLSQDPAIPIVVTGHSLGGCQTTVMAMYLADVLPAGTVIVPSPFAPPTAGNSVFAGLYDAAFDARPDQQYLGGTLWWNNLDLVPNAYAQSQATDATPGTLQYAEGLWQDYGGPGNLPFRFIIEHLAGTLPQYTQPTAGAVALSGSVASSDFIASWFAQMPSPPTAPPSSWEAQLMWQHFPPNYYTLLGTVSGVAPYPYAGGSLPPQDPTST